MKYIIMSGGKGSRWNNYLGITKQEAVINNENLLERTTRLIREYDKNANIIIISSNEKHKVINTTLHKPMYDDDYKSKYAYELIDEPIIYLYGDTFYEKDSINRILEPNNANILFYGNSYAIVGLRVNDYEYFKKSIDSLNNAKSTYSYFKQDCGNNTPIFMNIGREFCNIKYAQDYEKLKKVQELLFFQQKLLCNGIIWNVGIDFKNQIIADINNSYYINNIYSISASDCGYDFFSNIADFQKTKSPRNEFNQEIVIFDFLVESPSLKFCKDENKIACQEISDLKKYIKSKYRTNTDNIFDNFIHISDTPIEYLYDKKMIEQYMDKSKIKILKKEVNDENSNT